MNKQLIVKFGPIAGLIVSLLTTGVAGYRIFAAPLTHAEDVPAVPTPKPEIQDEKEEIVETVYDDVYVTPTPRPTTPPTSAVVGVTATGKSPTPGITVSVRSKTESHEDRFEDEREDHVEFEDKEEHEPKESPEPTERPEPTESPEH